jgi:hypothetical protein
VQLRSCFPCRLHSRKRFEIRLPQCFFLWRQFLQETSGLRRFRKRTATTLVFSAVLQTSLTRSSHVGDDLCVADEERGLFLFRQGATASLIFAIGDRAELFDFAGAERVTRVERAHGPTTRI